MKEKISYYLDKYIIIPHIFPKIYSKFTDLKIMDIQSTVNELLNSNKSLGRFGDGEIRWLLGIKNTHSFEKSSLSLSNKLIEVLKHHNDDFMIGLPDGFTLNKLFKSDSYFFWQRFITKYGNDFINYLNDERVYYNTSSSRPYIDYNNRKIAHYTFDLWKKIWKDKNILIIEGNQSRLGVNNDLFNNVKSIQRIECPITNAFESYNNILKYTINFLKNSKKKYLILISLGPTATILAFDLFQYGYRAIDIGHIDLEYEWYLMGAKEKVDLPYKYVNENTNGKYALPISSKKYNKEIIKRI